jgi:MFS family permease
MSRTPRLRVFQPFGNRRFSLYFSGQVISNTGTWFQNLALSLVVLEATGSAQALSGVTVAQFLPLLMLSLPAGRLADRVRPRTILLVTSLASALVVAGLAFVTLDPEPPIVAIYALVAALGSVHAFERVAAQAIIFEIVGPEALGRAVSLSTIALASVRRPAC